MRFDLRLEISPKVGELRMALLEERDCRDERVAVSLLENEKERREKEGRNLEQRSPS